MSLSEDLQAVAKKLLEEGAVDVVIGHAMGTLPLRSTPVFARNAEDAGKLVFDVTCGANLVRYLRKVPDRAAVVVKGCDARSLVEEIKEQQLDKEKIVLITVPCGGVIDLDAIMRDLSAPVLVPELLEAEIDGSDMRIKTREGEKTLAIEDFLVERCRSCDTREAVIPEGIRAEKVGGEAPSGDTAAALARLKEFEAKSPEERWARFAEEASKCILCYACRNACPMCYCPECFVESAQPAWLGREHTLSNAQVYHLMRALHIAGRCVGCGDCVRACPMGVDLGLLNEKLREVVKELYGADPGAAPDEPQPLAAYKEDDWQEFIM